MQKGLLSRLIIHEILHELKNKSVSFDDVFDKKIYNNNISLSDKKFITNVVLNSMRYAQTIDKIINLYVNKINNKRNAYLLFISSITQIVFLNFKSYAVINSTVELAKNKKIKVNPKFVNGLLRNILRNKNSLKLINSNYNCLPLWFKKNTKKWNAKQKMFFVETIREQPDNHIVFKSSKDLNNTKLRGKITTESSMIVETTGKIETLDGYNKGIWWVQDFSSMLPLYFVENIKNKLVIDMCAAPGGKTFQLLKYDANLTINEKNFMRANRIKVNLKRLNYNKKINIADALNFDENIKFDIVLLDAPCSAVGTIRRNPEIFFRNSSPKFKEIILLQSMLLEKAKNIVKDKGTIVYIVCSFLENEGKRQINNFLVNNKNFKLKKFKSKISKLNNLIDDNGFIYTLPQKFNNQFLIDGFFAAKLVKND